MTNLCISTSYLCISNSKKTVVGYLNEERDEIVIQHSEDNSSKSNDKTAPSTDDVYDGSVPTVSSAFSSCGTFFACCSYKSLFLWNTESWSLVSKKVVQRSVCKIIFSPKNDFIVVADKSGDVYIHSLDKFDEPGKLLLGHVSMLSDVLITQDMKYIITCDRDEKIRVSKFPNAYNIVCYCLGHEEFVSSINVLPSKSNVLLSSGGDGTFRLWDFVMGKQLLSYDVKKDVASHYGGYESPVIYRVSLLENFCGDVFVCSIVHKTKAIWVYCVKQVPGLSFEFSHYVTLEAEPCFIQAALLSRMIWLLQLQDEECLLALDLTTKLSKCTSSNVRKLQNVARTYFRELGSSVSQEKIITSLCKRKFDNEGEYFKRKQERLKAEKQKKKKK